MNYTHLEDVLLQLAAGTISRARAARRLQCSERQVNRLMVYRGVTRPISPVHAQRAAAAERKATRARVIQQLASGTATLESAGIDTKVSKRTLYRWAKQAESVQKVPQIAP